MYLRDDAHDFFAAHARRKFMRSLNRSMRRPAACERLIAIAQNLPALVEVQRRHFDDAILDEALQQSLVDLEQMRGGLKAVRGKLGSQDAIHCGLAAVERLGMRSERSDES